MCLQDLRSITIMRNQPPTTRRNLSPDVCPAIRGRWHGLGRVTKTAEQPSPSQSGSGHTTGVSPWLSGFASAISGLLAGNSQSLPGRLAKLLIAFMLACFLSPALAMADKASDDFNLGVGLYRSQRYELAAETFEQFVKDFPEHPRANLARLYLALSWDSLEKYAPAREQFLLYLETATDEKSVAEARYRCGECSYYLRDYPAAIKQLLEYLEKHPEHNRGDWAKLFLGDSYVAVGEWVKGESVLGPLVQTPTTTASVVVDARLSLGMALEALDRVPEALKQYEAAIAAKNSYASPRALIRVGAIQFKAEQYKDAAATYDALTTTYPTNSLAASASLGAGMAYYRINAFENALERFRAVPKDSSSAAQAILMAAMSLKDLGRVDESRQEFAEALKAAGDSPLAADILFQQAQMERSGEGREMAAQLFEDIADRWPSFGRTSECLFNAAELRLQLGQAERAERLFSRLNKEFLDVAKQPREQILLGRLFLARGDLDRATETLQKAVESIQDPSDRTAAVGRYYLVRSLFDGQRHDQVVQQASLMIDALKAEVVSDSLIEMRGALALAAISSLELKQYENVLKFADEFLAVATDPLRKADIVGTRAVALSHLNRFPEAIESLKSLVATNAEQPQTWTAVLQAAETALELNATDSAELLFSVAATGPENSAAREGGLSGVAWSQFRAQKYAEAEASFAALSTQFPDSKEAAKTAFMLARSIDEQGAPERTAVAYQAVFDKLTKDASPQPAGSETTAPMVYAWDAGKQAARTFSKLKQLEAADKAWERLTQAFPDAEGLDAILEEWAWMHSSAGDFKRSDVIHRLLLERFPESSFAGQARLSLAESLLDEGKLELSLQEMQAIVADTRYGDVEKERALFHVIELQSIAAQWQPAAVAARSFLADYAASPLAPQVRQFYGNALLQQPNSDPVARQQSIDEATVVLNALREDIVNEKIRKEDWNDRVWVVLAQAALAKQNYEQIDTIQEELKTRSPESRFAFQLNDLQGQRWKQQAPPDFEKSRKYFQLVTSDPQAEGTETAARCQFLLAETYRMQSELETAAREYFKVYLNYAGYDELRAQALFQVASCEAVLKKDAAAIRDFKELVREFPTSPLVKDASEQVRKLERVSP